MADNVYQTVTSNGSSARVEFFLPLRNATGQRVNYKLQVGRHDLHGRPDQHRLRHLNAWASEQISLGYFQSHSPSGSGAPTPAQVAQTIRITC